jgi:hypothetical protein
MAGSRTRPRSQPTQGSSPHVDLTRRELLAGASAGAAALLLHPPETKAQTPGASTVVFSRTTVVTADLVHHDVALAIEGDKIAACTTAGARRSSRAS